MPVRRGRKGKQGTGAKQAAISAALSTQPTDVAVDRSTTAARSSSGTTPFQQQQQQQQLPTKQTTDFVTTRNDINDDIDDQNRHQSLILTSDKRRGVYECDYCGCDISQTPRIRCAICIDFDVCCDCFITTDPQTAIARLQTQQHAIVQQQQHGQTWPNGGANDEPTTTTGSYVPPQHDPLTHGYRVCDSTRYPLFPINAAVVSSIGGTNSSISATTATTASLTTPSASSSRKKKLKSTDANSCSGTELRTTNDEMMVMDSSDDTNNHMEGVELYSNNNAVTDNVAAIGGGHDDDDDDENGEKGVQLSKNNDTGDSKLTMMAVTAASSIIIDPPMITMTAGDDPKTIWTMEEDLRLLRGIQTHGLGNWTEISDAVVGQGSQGKTPKRCMERYFDDYMGRYGCILPPYTLIGESTATTTTASNPDTDDDVEMTVSSLGDGESKDMANNNNNNNNSSQATTTLPTTTTTATESAIRSSKRRSTMLRTPGGSMSFPPAKKYIAVPTESLPEYQYVQLKPFLPTLQSGSVTVGQEVGRDQASKAELAYARTISGLDSKEQMDRIRTDWERNRLNKPGGPTVLPMRPDDIPKLPGSELSGFMPRRGDFDIEYDNNAEEMIADMEFLPGESEQDRNLKLAVLAIYNSKLRERNKRKQFIISRKLYDYKTYQEEYRKLPRDERDLVLRMRLFERFHTPEEHKVFIADLLRAKRLRKEIAKLQMYRRIGIRTQLEAEKYEIDKARRLFHKNAVTQKMNEMTKAETSGSSSGMSAMGMTPGTIKKSSSLTLADNIHESESSQYWKQYRTTDRKVRRSINRGGVEDANRTLEPQPSSDSVQVENSAASVIDTTVTPSETVIPQMLTITSTEIHNDLSKQDKDISSTEIDNNMDVDDSTPQKNNQSGDTDHSIDDERQVGDDIVHLPGYNQLSNREVDLIRSIQITPQQYIQIKKALIYESLQHGLLDDTTTNNDTEDEANDTRRRRTSLSGGTTVIGSDPSNGGVSVSSNSKRNTNTVFLLDIERRGTIVDFIIHAGWITTQYGKSVLQN